MGVSINALNRLSCFSSATDPTYGAPPGDFVLDYSSGGTSYTTTFTTPFSANGEFFFEVVQSPDNSLRSNDSLLGMVNRAGNGDTVLVEQLYEYKYWGPSSSNPTDDPNPRLEAYIDAARRGALVNRGNTADQGCEQYHAKANPNPHIKTRLWRGYHVVSPAAYCN